MIGSLADLADRKDIAVIDTRLDHSAFFGGHIPGALYAPFDKTFPTIVGSYVDPEMPIYLVIDAYQLDAGVRSLIRIGYDHVVGYVTPNVLEQYQELGGRLDTIFTTDFEYISALRNDDPVLMLDVRTRVEFEAAHVPDAVHIAHTRLMDHIDEIPQTHPVWVHCATGRRAASAVAFLKRHGYDVVHVNDTFASWESSNRVAL
jgi:hydroxyacylglutathione hydrolase